MINPETSNRCKIEPNDLKLDGFKEFLGAFIKLNPITIRGTGSDFIDGGTGDDSVYGGWGNDVIVGGSGVDTLELEEIDPTDWVVTLRDNFNKPPMYLSDFLEYLKTGEAGRFANAGFSGTLTAPDGAEVTFLSIEKISVINPRS